MTKDSYSKLKERLLEIVKLNNQIAAMALSMDQPLKGTALDLKAYANDMAKMAEFLSKKAEEMDVLAGKNKEEVRLSMDAADITRDAATLGINLNLMEDVMRVASSDKIRALLNQSDDEDLKNGILKLERSRLEFLRDCSELGLEMFNEKYPNVDF